MRLHYNSQPAYLLELEYSIYRAASDLLRERTTPKDSQEFQIQFLSMYHFICGKIIFATLVIGCLAVKHTVLIA